MILSTPMSFGCREQCVSAVIGMSPQGLSWVLPPVSPGVWAPHLNYRGDSSQLPGWHKGRGEGMSCLVSPRSTDRRDLSEGVWTPSCRSPGRWEMAQTGLPSSQNAGLLSPFSMFLLPC